MKTIYCVFLLQLIIKIECQQYFCSVRDTKSNKSWTTVTVLEKCPINDQCQYSNNMYDLSGNSYYVEKESGKVKIRFSWKPKFPNISAPFYGFKIITREKFSNAYGSTFFCPDISMSCLKWDFIFECNKITQPKKVYSFTISPLLDIADKSFLTFKTIVPTCQDRKIASSSACRPPSAKINVTKNFSCVDRTFEVEYELPHGNGNAVTALAYFRVCRSITSSSYVCLNIKELPILKDRPLINKVNVTIPRNISTTGFFFVQVFVGREAPHLMNVTDIFQASKECVYSSVKPTHFSSHFAAVIASVLLSILILCSLGYKTKCSANAISTLVKPSHDSEPIIPQSQTLYIVFVGDHAKHQDVVLKFAAFLKCDLGFQIVFELYQTEEVLKDPSLWMEASLSQANKVLFIWSPIAAQRWKQRDESASLSDMFTPALRKAVADMWNSKNYDKYYFLNFDYCDSAVIPAGFKSHRRVYFNLMKEFDKFYCKIMGLKVSNCVHSCFDESFCELLDSEFGNAFLKAVDDMRNYVKEHPNWFEEVYTTNSTEQACVGCSVSSSTSNVATKLRNELVIIPPSPIRNKNSISHSESLIFSTDSAIYSDFDSSMFPESKSVDFQHHSIVEIDESGLQSELNRTLASRSIPTKMRLITPLDSGLKQLFQENNKTFKSVERVSEERLSVEDDKCSQPLTAKQYSNLKNNSLLDSIASANESKKAKPVVILAPIETCSNPMASLAQLNNRTQITRL